MVTWVRAWRAGLVPYDEVATEVAGDEEQLVADCPGTWTDVPLAEALRVFSRLHPDEIRLVLPAPGDPRGLPGPGAFSGAALVAEECVLAGPLGLVPEVRRHTSGSGDEFSTVLWRVYPVPSAAPVAQAGEVGPAEAEAELSTAVLAATSALARLDVARWRPELAGALAALRRPDFAGDLPPGYDARSRRLFARASMLDRVLALASADAPGAAVNTFEAQHRDAALRPLFAACRRALVAACNTPLAGQA
jgi:hypothetical protein